MISLEIVWTGIIHPDAHSQVVWCKCVKCHQCCLICLGGVGLTRNMDRRMDRQG